MSEKIGIIGLGRVGMPVAGEYLKRGYKVYGYARRKEVIEEFIKMGGIHKSSPAEVAKISNTLIVLVLNDQQVLDVILSSNGLLQGTNPNSVIICMSTINRNNLHYVATECNKKNVGFVDCPFTGGPGRVPTASLTLIVSSSPRLIDLVKPILSVIGNIVHVGDKPGLGQAVKHCNQLMVGATHAATMEVITLARKLGLNASIVCKVISEGISGSDYFRLLSESALNDTPSPGRLGQMCKDISIVANTLEEVKMTAYVAKATSRYFVMAEELGMQEEEGAKLIEVIKKVSDRNT